MGEQTVVFREFLDAVGLHGQSAAAAAGLSATDWFVLGVLDTAGPLSAGELAARTGLTTGATTRMIDRLERERRVRRVTDPHDRRRVIVERVPGTLADVDEIVAPARREVAAVFARYTPDQQEVLFDFFARAAPAFRSATEQLRTRAAQHRRRAGTEPS